MSKLAGAFVFRHFRCILIGLLAVTSAALPCAAKVSEDVTQPDASVGAALRTLGSRAGVIFVGRVTDIEPQGGVVLVQFAVEQTVQGAVGGAYTLREWAGLWPQGMARYVPGQHVLIFLNPANSAGLSTPVDGMEGVVPVLVQGAAAPMLADVRRLETRVLRAVGAPLSGADRAAISLSDAVETASGWRNAAWSEPVRVALPVAYVPAAGNPWHGTLRVDSGPAVAAESGGAGGLQPLGAAAAGSGTGVMAPLAVGTQASAGVGGTVTQVPARQLPEMSPPAQERVQ